MTIPVNVMFLFNEQNDSEKYINKYSPYLIIKITNDNKDDVYSYINITAEVDLDEEVILNFTTINSTLNLWLFVQ